jgi:hypothetical protein
MPWDHSNDGEPGSARERRSGETEAEPAFWCRYWKVLRVKGVPAGREVWYERACWRFIRELKPRRLKEATAGDLTQFLGLVAQQPDSAGWKVRQADHALRILFQEKWSGLPGQCNGRSDCQRWRVGSKGQKGERRCLSQPARLRRTLPSR